MPQNGLAIAGDEMSDPNTITDVQSNAPLAAETRTIEDLRRRACTPVARSLAVAFGGGRPREQFDASMSLAESIAERACRFLNSLYLHSARDLGSASVFDVEQRLSELARKNLSFGDFVSSMELFLRKLSPANLDPSVGSVWQTFAASLALKMSTDAGEQLAKLELIKTAREKYSIPESCLDQYVNDHRGGTPKRPTVVTVLTMAATYRNAKAHNHDWFAHGDLWYGMLVGHWRRVLEEVLLHPPIFQLLAGVEVVTTEAVARMAAPGQYLWVAAREELDELRRPLGESRLASSTHISSAQHWARRPDDDKAPLQWMFPSRAFPENVESLERRMQRYCARVLGTYLNTGALHSTDIDTALQPLRGELGIEEEVAKKIEAELIGAVRAAESELRTGEDKGGTAKIIGMIEPFRADFLDLGSSLAALDRKRAATVYAVIEDQWPISHSTLETESEMTSDELDRALRQLLADNERPVRKVETLHGKTHYRIPILRDANRINEAIELVRSQPHWIRGLWPLLEVCQRFFVEEGHADLNVAVGRVLGDETEDETTGVPRLLFAARGEVVRVSSVPDLLREVAARFGSEPALKAKVPFASGRRRNLVASEARHVAGHPFVLPLQIGDLFFEANQSRYSALNSLRQWFAAASIPVERAEIDGNSIDALRMSGGGTTGVAVSNSSKLVLHIRIGDRTERVAGGTAGEFLSGVVQVLVEEGRLKIDQLPISIGRIRYLLAQEPRHANGRPFDAPVEVEGMFIESSLTRKDARIHAATICRSADVEVLDPDDGAEADL